MSDYTGPENYKVSENQLQTYAPRHNNKTTKNNWKLYITGGHLHCSRTLVINF